MTKTTPSKSKVPRNPNKRPCVARNISFPVQAENKKWLRYLKAKEKSL